MIRKLRKTDVEAIANLFFETVHKTCKNDYTQDELFAWAPKEMDMQNFKQSFKNTFAIVADVNGEILGFGDMEKDGYINRLYVRHDKVGTGIGAVILAKLVAEAKRKKLRSVKLEASRTAIEFYKSQGFLDGGEIAKFKNDITFVNKRMVKFI